MYLMFAYSETSSPHPLISVFVVVQPLEHWCLAALHYTISSY